MKNKDLPRAHYRAAGGVVVHDGQVLLLDRPSRGEVRLPKGHIDPGETAAQAALREVREESGYADLSILAELGTQTVRFVDPHKKRHVTREETYFMMGLNSQAQIERDEHEDVGDDLEG